MLAFCRPLARLATIAAAVGTCLLAVGWTRTPPAEASAQRVNLRVTVALVPGSGSTLHYRGTFAGTPFGRGTADVRTAISGAGSAQIRFALTTSRGSLRGSANVTLTYRRDTVICRGTATISGGTGAYTRARARGLRVSGTTAISSDKTTLSLTGQVTS